MAKKSKRHEPVLKVMSTLAALQAFAATSAFTEILPPQSAGLIVAGLAAAQVGLAFWVRGRVSPK